MFKANAVLPEDVVICSSTFSIPIENIICGLDELYSCRCMGLRFLAPVLFIKDVELTKHSRNTVELIHSTMLMLKSMKLKPALRDSLSGRRLTRPEQHDPGRSLLHCHSDYNVRARFAPHRQTQDILYTIKVKGSQSPVTPDAASSISSSSCSTTMWPAAWHGVAWRAVPKRRRDTNAAHVLFVQ